MLCWPWNRITRSACGTCCLCWSCFCWGFASTRHFFRFLIGALAGALVAVVMQPQVVTEFANSPDLGYGLTALKSVWMAMANGFISTSGYEQIDALFTGGGMESMLVTVWLILGAMSFGAMMDYGGFNARLITPVIDKVKSIGGTIATVMFTSLGLNIVAGDQYIAIVLPARMFLLEFRKTRHPPGDPGDRGRKLRDDYLAVDPLELVRRVHVGCPGRFNIYLLPLLFLQLSQFYPGNGLRFPGDQYQKVGTGGRTPFVRGPDPGAAGRSG